MERRLPRVWTRPTGAAIALLATLLCASPAAAQGLDCNRLAAQIAAAGRGGSGGNGQYAAAARKQQAELSRTSAYATSLGCDRSDFFLFGGGSKPPQCAGINNQIARMQANLQGLSQAASGGDGSRAALQQRFDAYCRGTENYGTARNFFEHLFNVNRQDRLGAPQPDIMVPPSDETNDGSNARGGSQALCVRTCDGGYFPMSVSARRRDLSDLQDLCAALCPGTEAKLYTRVPGREVSTAVSMEGDAYGDLPNALKFEKTFDKTCSCKPANKSWVEALAEAERLLGDDRKGDIVVTAERAEELSRVAGPAGGRDKGRKFDPRAIAKAAGIAPPADPATTAVQGVIERQKRSADEAVAEDAAAAASAPTASTESSGIGKSGTGASRVLGRTDGLRTESTLPGEPPRKVRVIPQ